MIENVKAGRVNDFAEAYTTLNERFINEIIDKESEKSKDKTEPCVCNLCGSFNGVQKENTSRSYLLIGDGEISQEDKQDPNV